MLRTQKRTVRWERLFEGRLLGVAAGGAGEGCWGQGSSATEFAYDAGKPWRGGQRNTA
jgi:hypothetical protein